MKGLILASGAGKRLWPLTRTVPRCMIPVQGKTILERLLLTLKSAGITEIVLALHHQARFIQERLGDGSQLGVRLHCVVEDELTGIAGAVRHCRHLLGSDTVVVCNDNILADLDLPDLLAYHHEQQADATLVLHASPDLQAHGTLDVDTNLSLSKLIGTAPDESGFLHAAGIRVLSPRALNFVENQKTGSLGDALAELQSQGGRMEGYILEGYWSVLSTWEQYASLLWHVGRGLVPEPPST